MTSGKVPWYKVAFGPLYKVIYPHRTDEVADQESAFVLNRINLSSP